MLKLRGVSVYPSAVERVLRTFTELGAEWFLVRESRGAVQEITVQREAPPPLPAGETTALAIRVSDSIRQRVGIRLEVQIFGPGELVTEEAAEGRVKARRIIERTTPPPEPAKD